MTKEEFIKNCQSLGYCTKEIAEKYCEDKDVLTEEDYIKVCRESVVRIPTANANHRCGYGWTTKGYWHNCDPENR